VHKLLVPAFDDAQCHMPPTESMPALSAMLLIFCLQFSLLFFHVRQPGSTAAYVVYPISYIGRCQTFGKVPFLVRNVQTSGMILNWF